MIVAGVPNNITIHHQVLPLTAAVLIVLFTLELVRRRKLREEYAMLWIAASAVLLAFAIFPRLLWYLSDTIGLVYHTTMIILCFSFLSLVVIHLSVVISHNAEDTRQMAQRIAMLEHKLEQLSRCDTDSSRACEKEDCR